MKYWIVLIVLAVLIVVTIIVTIVTIIKESREYRHYELEEEYGREEEYDVKPARKSRGRQEEPRVSSDGKKRRWKIILENPDTGERFDYIFYDSLGIGRTTKAVAFEQFLSVPYDKKVSKVHCAIVRNKASLYLKDEGSRNHTYLNGKKVQKPILIQKEDVISIGETDFEVIKILRETR